jgi:hypothetical protein
MNSLPTLPKLPTPPSVNRPSLIVKGGRHREPKPQRARRKISEACMYCLLHCLKEREDYLSKVGLRSDRIGSNFFRSSIRSESDEYSTNTRDLYHAYHVR